MKAETATATATATAPIAPHPVTTTVRSRLALATSRKSIAKHISAEYSDYKQKLITLATDLDKLLDHVRSIDVHWTALVHSQHKFADDVYHAYPHPDPLKDRLAVALDRVQVVADDISSPKSPKHPTVSEATRIQAFQDEVRSVLADCPKVERAYLETAHYDAKAEKLAKKGKANEQAARNLEKLTEARVQYQESLDQLVGRMKQVYAKYPSVFSGAYASFWLAQKGASGVVSENARTLASPENIAPLAVPAQREVDVDVDVVTPVVAEERKVHEVTPAATVPTPRVLPKVTEKKTGGLFDFPKKKKVEANLDEVSPTTSSPEHTQQETIVETKPESTIVDEIAPSADKKKAFRGLASFIKKDHDQAVDTAPVVVPEATTTHTETKDVHEITANPDEEVFEDALGSAMEVTPTSADNSAFEKKKGIFGGLPHSLKKHQAEKDTEADNAINLPQSGVDTTEHAADKKKGLLANLQSTLKKQPAEKEAVAAAGGAAVLTAAAVSLAPTLKSSSSDLADESTAPPTQDDSVKETGADSNTAPADHGGDKKRSLFRFSSTKKQTVQLDPESTATHGSDDDNHTTAEAVESSPKPDATGGAGSSIADRVKGIFPLVKKPTGHRGSADDKDSATKLEGNEEVVVNKRVNEAATDSDKMTPESPAAASIAPVVEPSDLNSEPVKIAGEEITPKPVESSPVDDEAKNFSALSTTHSTSKIVDASTPSSVVGNAANLHDKDLEARTHAASRDVGSAGGIMPEETMPKNALVDAASEDQTKTSAAIEPQSESPVTKVRNLLGFGARSKESSPVRDEKAGPEVVFNPPETDVNPSEPPVVKDSAAEESRKSDKRSSIFRLLPKMGTSRKETTSAEAQVPEPLPAAAIAEADAGVETPGIGAAMPVAPLTSESTEMPAVEPITDVGAKKPIFRLGSKRRVGAEEEAEEADAAATEKKGIFSFASKKKVEFSAEQKDGTPQVDLAGDKDNAEYWVDSPIKEDGHPTEVDSPVVATATEGTSAGPAGKTKESTV